MLKRVASLAKPIMRKRSWHLPTLGEFLPDDPNLLDVNRGHQIFLRLRPAANPSTFYDLEFVMGTMLHELTHNHRGPHDEVFYKYLDGLEDEYAALKRSGYAGEGFYSRGRVLGASASDKRRAAEAAEKRRQGARVLGGPARAPSCVWTCVFPFLSLRLNASANSHRPQAAIRRVRDSHSCASAAQGQAQEEAQKATQASEIIDLTLEDDKFDYNDFVFDDDDIMIVEDGVPLINEGNPLVGNGEAGPSNKPPRTINYDDYLLDEDDIMIVEDEAGPSNRPAPRPAVEEADDDIEIVFDGTVKQKFATNIARPGHPQQGLPAPPTNSTSRPSEKIPPPRQWTCAICTLVNDEKASQCDVCAALRPAPPKTDHWTCLRCGETPIPNDFWSCRFCGFVKTKS
ncbi:WLM domain-containing protein [Schizophyllum commune]